MTTNRSRDRRLPWIGHIALTIGILGGALGTTLLVSGALKAVEHMDRVNNTLAELSHYIADGHASIRGRASAPATAGGDALDRFDEGLERRVRQVQNLKTLLEQQATASMWTEPLLQKLDVSRIEDERRSYVATARIAAAMIDAPAVVGLRPLDLRAQMLIQIVEGVRDSSDEARGRTFIVVDAMVALSSGIGLLLIVYLIWRPRLVGAGHSAEAPQPERSVQTAAMPFAFR